MSKPCWYHGPPVLSTSASKARSLLDEEGVPIGEFFIEVGVGTAMSRVVGAMGVGHLTRTHGARVVRVVAVFPVMPSKPAVPASPSSFDLLGRV